jgi:hypothetical protein
VRVARETYVLLARFRDDTVKKQKGEAARLPLFVIRADFSESGFHRSLVMVAVMPGVAVPAVVAVMRGCWIVCLRLSGTRAILRC